MYFSKSIELILVGIEKEREYFKKYFTEVYLLDNNELALSEYETKRTSVVFLTLENDIKKSIEVTKKLKSLNPKLVIVLLVNEICPHELLDFLPLHLSGVLKKPFEEEKVAKVLENIKNDLSLSSKQIFKLKENYFFDKKENILYSSKKEEQKLTKNEALLIKLLVNEQSFVSSETLEYNIWEEDSEYEDCNKRLKNLIYTLRKKLPKKSIRNSYKLGYKLMGEGI